MHCRITETYLWHSWHEVATGRLELVDDGIGWHRPHAGDALHVLIGEVGLALLLALGQGHVEGFGAHDAAVHLCHGFSGLLRGGEADESEALGASFLQHHLPGCHVEWRSMTAYTCMCIYTYFYTHTYTLGVAVL